MMAEEAVKNLALYIMNEECYDNYFVDHDFLDVPCFKALLSKGLGMGIIAGSLLVKVPQVLKILANKSGEGISVMGVLLDLVAITFHMSYNFMNGYPFSAWGDAVFLILQTAAIAALIFFYGGSSAKAGVFLAAYSTIVYVLNSGLTPLKIIFMAQSINIPIILVGKMTQAYTNYKNKSTGQLSAATCFMLLAGSLARIFTSIQETGDPMMVLTFGVSSFANAVIVAQMVYYWKKTGKKPIKTKVSPKKAKSKKIN
ncbi:mannose-P-dolichol utilization defect 1 protein homolog [Episyrphus balteatus]|uniref:mannose-P-dolichol utilization defect 1 protein homolog n=1 Tax=Episyrphus balteatus TaxID=286459 RepID=UPI0024865C09|nr:mannose-P-dolichol utilization defect 1 protein homolog [Episyrphus balteatus]